MRKVIVWAAAATIVASAGLGSMQPAQAQWGTLKGKVTLDGEVPAVKLLVKKGDAAAKDAAVCAADDVPDESLVVDKESKGIANVVIWLAKAPAKIHPDLQKSKDPEVVFDQKGCRFIPHVLVVRTDQKVRVISDDAIAHNTHTYPLKNKQENFIVAPSDRKGVVVPSVNVEERLPASIGCDIHPWMRAWWVILEHPYVAVTNARGEFEIANLPTGDHEFRVWQEKAGYLERSYKVTIKAGDNEGTPIKAALSKFEK
jgi:hypothetical protein